MKEMVEIGMTSEKIEERKNGRNEGKREKIMIRKEDKKEKRRK
jgi:hypothetical protein